MGLKKPDTKENILFHLYDVEDQPKLIYKDRNQIRLPYLAGGVMVTLRSLEGAFWRMEVFSVLLRKC